MHHHRLGRAIWVAALLLVAADPGTSQQPTGVNLTVPPPPPPELPPLELPLATRLPIPLVPELLPRLVGTVSIPAGTAFDVVLATPLSTRIAQPGQPVEFRTTTDVPLGDGFLLPEETLFRGSVVHLRRPGGFGRSGVLRVDVSELDLRNGAVAPVVARLHASDPVAYSPGGSDRNPAANILDLAQWVLLGTVFGREVAGGKGAAIGAGAGATAALILLSSRRGPEMYLEPGTPFRIVLERPVELPAEKVFAAQHAALRARSVRALPEGAVDPQPAADATARETESGRNDPGRPKLKRRPKPAQP
ncbi:MAG: hypothetical protein K6U09_00770 [Acidobacteriia bacterium]|jgi:hypothetical protein|nr:hypothetical protein [Terriglobia bacterium]